MSDALFHPEPLPAHAPGRLVGVSRAQAGWGTIDFSVRRLVAGQPWRGQTGGCEAALVVLGGEVSVDFGDGPCPLGERPDVFSGYASAVYLPPGTAFEVQASAFAEVAECSVPSASRHPARLIRPDQLSTEIRGGGNATRQIINLIGAEFPAEKLLICEVYTPSGNWSSYPPHKHEVHNPPAEVDLDEIYYYRIRGESGFAFQRLYSSDGRRDEVVTVADGDLVLVRDGYHPVVAAYGYDCYYLNVLAGSAHSWAASDDPRYANFRDTWPAPDPRLPLVRQR